MDTVRPPVRGLSRAGRDGFLRLAFARRGSSTVLTERRFRTPLQVLEPLAFPDDPAAGVMLLNPTGGVLGGDRLTTELQLDDGAHVLVTTPSATRVYGSPTDTAVQSTAARVGRAAILEYVPDHVIPHPHARFRQMLDVELATDASLLLWDAWALGRIARGEEWSFSAIASAINIHSAGRPLYIDRFRLAPSSLPLRSLAGTEGHGYFASWVVLHTAPRDWPALGDRFIAHLSGTTSALGSASVLGGGGCVARVLAPSAYALTEAQAALWSISREWLLGLSPPPLRKS